MIKVGILNELYFEYVEEFRKEFEDCEFTLYEETEFTDSEIIWGNLEVSQMNKYPNLRWVQSLFAGVDNYVDKKMEIPINVKITAANGVYDITIAEYLLGVHLSLYKNLNTYRDNQSENLWKISNQEVRFIKGSTVLVWGMGGIGTQYAKFVKSMGAYVIGVRRTDKNKPEFVDEIYLAHEVEEVLYKADMIVVTMPKTSKSENLIDKNKLTRMKDGAMIMNIGRGKIINTEDLCDALESGKLSGAGLDVVEPEPLPKEHRLWKMKNVIITPHASGLSYYKEPMEMNLKLFKDNLRKYLNGEELINEVDFNEGYRKIRNV